MKKLQELKPQQVKRIFEISVIVIVIIAGIGSFYDILPLAIIGLGLMIIAFAFNITFYRCPHCGKHLGRDGGDYCQHCGTSFDENPKS